MSIPLTGSSRRLLLLLSDADSPSMWHSGAVKVCNKNDTPFSSQQGLSVGTACADKNPGGGYLCTAYSPKPISDNFSYAFAVTNGGSYCCKCYELQWTNGPSVGKVFTISSGILAILYSGYVSNSLSLSLSHRQSKFRLSTLIVTTRTLLTGGTLIFSFRPAAAILKAAVLNGATELTGRFILAMSLDGRGGVRVHRS
jgi:Glycosyl hydrolase family 45